jgi:hypothetical protein
MARDVNVKQLLMLIASTSAQIILAQDVVKTDSGFADFTYQYQSFRLKALPRTGVPVQTQRVLLDDGYEEKYDAWKQSILANTAVTAIAAQGRLSVFVTLTADKYTSVTAAQMIAQQLAASYCRATGVRRAHFYIMLDGRTFADAWGE